jgi:hypothetical protein
MIQREYLRRIQVAFDAASIEMLTRQTVVVMPPAS